MDKISQYYIFNDYIRFVITTSINNEEYVIALVKRFANDRYGLEYGDLEDIKCEFLCDFYKESIVDLNVLENKR